MRAFPAALTLVLMVSCGGGGPIVDLQGQKPADLWGSTFVSVGVTEDGESRPLVKGTRIEVTFEYREGVGGVRWQAGCNTLGSGVEISRDRLHLTEAVTGTAQRCRDELNMQDQWLINFFTSDPNWDLTNGRLALISGETVIQLEQLN
jgi:heat shock protein HslJ